MKRLMNLLFRFLLVILLGFVVLAVARPPRDAVATPKPCVEFDLSYSARTVAPGTIFDFDQGLANCSDRRLRVRVRIAASGPCPFAHPGSARYTLDANSGVFLTGLFIGPSCPGRYRVSGRALVRGVVVARAHAGFTVVAH
jgi:hypothetical protein